MGARPVYWTSSNLQGCIVSRRRVSRTPFTSDSGCQSHFDGKPQRLPKACQMASRTQTEDGSLLRVPQEVPAAHMTASLGPPGSHLVRVAGWHLVLERVGLGGSVPFRFTPVRAVVLSVPFFHPFSHCFIVII